MIIWFYYIYTYLIYKFLYTGNFCISDKENTYFWTHQAILYQIFEILSHQSMLKITNTTKGRWEAGKEQCLFL